MVHITLLLFQNVNYFLLFTIVALSGISANIINILIFLKQGFKITVNISFLSLAISDLICLLCCLWFHACTSPFFNQSSLFDMSADVGNLIIGWPHACFAAVSSWIIVFMMTERYLCIAKPLKVKGLVTCTKTGIIMCLIYVLNILSAMSVCGIPGTEFHLQENITLDEDVNVVTAVRNNWSRLPFLLHPILSIMAFIAVMFWTPILILKLKWESQWRINSTSLKEHIHQVSKRNKQTARMVAMLSSFLLVFNTPTPILYVIVIFHPDIDTATRSYRMLISLWSLGFLLETLKSIINIVLFCRMSSRYSKTFNELLTSCKRQKQTGQRTT